MAKREPDIFLSCDRPSCDEHIKRQIIRVKLDGYVPGEIKCVVCGDQLSSDQEKRISNELFRMGLKDLPS